MPEGGRLATATRAAADVGALVRFRTATLRGRTPRAARLALVVVVSLTVAAAVVPAFVPGAATSERAGDVVVLLPTVLLAFLLTTTLALSVAGGGRELLSAVEGVAFPVSPTTDHLGALLMAPLNIAWLMQAWSILAVTAYVSGPGGLLAVQTTVLAWLLTATAAAQALAWGVEWVRRGPHGMLVVRTGAVLIALGASALVVTERVTATLDKSPTLHVALVALNGNGGDATYWLVGTVLLLLAAVACVVLGAWVAHAVSRRAPREQLRGEGRTFPMRAAARSDHAMLVRLDRASVWRSVPLRRGLVTLAVLPAAVAASGRIEWHLLPILPGIVAAGGALLFGVNTWCLDGRGALWRDSLPVSSSVVFVARARVLAEVLLAATTLPLLVASVRSGVPTSAEVVSLVATVVVVTLQVVARSMHWSVRRPYAMDLRSARGAPAPPLAMVTYSAYLSLTSTLTGLLFVLTAQAGSATWAVLVAVPLVLLALRRLVATAGEWSRPPERARVIATVVAQ